jgi:hypothetical protein
MSPETTETYIYYGALYIYGDVGMGDTPHCCKVAMGDPPHYFTFT